MPYGDQGIIFWIKNISIPDKLQNPLPERVLYFEAIFVIPFGQFSNKFYEHLKGFYDLKILIIKDLKNKH